MAVPGRHWPGFQAITHLLPEAEQLGTPFAQAFLKRRNQLKGLRQSDDYRRNGQIGPKERDSGRRRGFIRLATTRRMYSPQNKL